MKHGDVAHLWLQDEVRSNGLNVVGSRSSTNGTRALIARHAEALGVLGKSLALPAMVWDRDRQ